MDQRKVCERGLSSLSWHGKLMVLAEYALRNPIVLNHPMVMMLLNSVPWHTLFIVFTACMCWGITSINASQPLVPYDQQMRYDTAPSLHPDLFCFPSDPSFLLPLPLPSGVWCPSWIKARFGLKSPRNIGLEHFDGEERSTSYTEDGDWLLQIKECSEC